MRWPHIFFKTRTPQRNEEPAVPSSLPPVSDDSKPASADSSAPKVNPVAIVRAPTPASNAPTLKSNVLESRHLAIPGTGGIASRVPPRSTTVSDIPVPAPTEPIAPIDPAPPKKDVVQAMAEADSLRALTRSGGVLLVKRPTDILPVVRVIPKSEDIPKSELPEPPAITEEKKDDPIPKPSTATSSLPPGVTIFRRKTKMADVARIVLPSKHEEPVSPPPESSAPSPAAIVPPSFPVTVATGTIIGASTAESSSSIPEVEQPSPSAETPSNTQEPPTSSTTTSPVQQEEKPPESPAVETPPPVSAPIVAEPEKKQDLPPPNPIAEEKPAEPKSEPVPEQSKAPPFVPPTATPPSAVNLPVSSREKQEFLLSNGERILGRILSETADTLFINHETLGVLTIPREQIAKRLIEIILINGDRIVGDVIAETPECIYVRHASLGMLTVPHKQRSTRVVEAILKDGDRILGEVLAETENFTVIRSATLGTVAVQHTQVAMLNRKIEQIQLKALPPAAPAIENKPAT